MNRKRKPKVTMRRARKAYQPPELIECWRDKSGVYHWGRTMADTQVADRRREYLARVEAGLPSGELELVFYTTQVPVAR